MTTAHKSKGLEYDHVVIAQDFHEEATGEEMNLLYVAATRAMKTLEIDQKYFCKQESVPVQARTAGIGKHMSDADVERTFNHLIKGHIEDLERDYQLVEDF